MHSPLVNLFLKNGTQILIPNHFRILLEDDESLFYLEKGTLELFIIGVDSTKTYAFDEVSKRTTPFTSDQLEGRHTFFKEFSSGDLLFPFPSHKLPYAHLIARADGLCQLYKLRISEILEHPEINIELENGFTKWLTAFNSHDYEDFPNPKTCTLKQLHDFHTYALNIFAHKTEIYLKKEAEYNQLQDELDNNNFSLAINKLENILEKEILVKEQETDILYKTCQLVGDRLKLTFNPSQQITKSISYQDRLRKLCFDSRIYYRFVKLPEDWWKADLGPLVGFYGEQGKPVALLPESGHYNMIDLEKNNLSYVDKSIDRSLALEAVMFYRQMPDKKFLSGKDVILYGLSDKWKSLLFAILLGGAATFLSLFFPIANNILFNYITPYYDDLLLGQLTISLILVAVGISLFTFAREYIILRFQGLLTHDLQTGTWQRIFNLPVSFFRRFEIGDLILRAFAIESIRQKVAGPNLRIMINSIFAFFYLIPMFYFSPYLAMVGLSIGLVGVIFSVWAAWKQLKANLPIFELQGQAHAFVLQFLFGISKIRLAGAEKLCFVIWEKIFYQIKKLQWLLEKAINRAIDTNYTIANTSPLILYAAAFFWIQNDKDLTLNIGNFIAFFAAYLPFSLALNDLCLSLIDIGSSLTAWKRSQPIFKEATEVDPNKSIPGVLLGQVRVDQLSFKYEPDSPLLLDNISFYADPGEFVAIVGTSGSGKSTFARLLIGFETPEKGAIYYDGKDLATLDLRQIRRQIGTVLQTSSVLSGTLRENLVTGGFYTDEEIINALHLAGFKEDLKHLPMGLETIITNDGATFSGGQRQRIIIARALISRPPIIIFDEATSSLDNTTQDFVTNQLMKLNCTRIVIAHRLSTIKNAARIYVFDKGKVIEMGTFDQLVQQQGFFYNLLVKQNFD